MSVAVKNIYKIKNDRNKKKASVEAKKELIGKKLVEASPKSQANSDAEAHNTLWGKRSWMIREIWHCLSCHYSKLNYSGLELTTNDSNREKTHDFEKEERAKDREMH